MSTKKGTTRAHPEPVAEDSPSRGSPSRREFLGPSRKSRKLHESGKKEKELDLNAVPAEELPKSPVTRRFHTENSSDDEDLMGNAITSEFNSTTTSTPTTRKMRRSMAQKKAERERESYEHYNKVARKAIELISANKINSKNAFDFDVMVLNKIPLGVEDENGWNQASATLDASAKIYGYRVDNTHSDAYRVLGGLNRTEVGAADEEDEYLDPADLEGGRDEIARLKKKLSMKETLKGASGTGAITLEKEKRNITVNKYDLEFNVDPLFKRTSAKFDEGGARGLLLNHLNIDTNFQILLDSSDTALTSAESVHLKEEEEQESERGLDVELPASFSLLDNIQLCPELLNFKEMALDSTGRDGLKKALSFDEADERDEEDEEEGDEEEQEGDEDDEKEIDTSRNDENAMDEDMDGSHLDMPEPGMDMSPGGSNLSALGGASPMNKSVSEFTNNLVEEDSATPFKNMQDFDIIEKLRKEADSTRERNISKLESKLAMVGEGSLGLEPIPEDADWTAPEQWKMKKNLRIYRKEKKDGEEEKSRRGRKSGKDKDGQVKVKDEDGEGAEKKKGFDIFDLEDDEDEEAEEEVLGKILKPGAMPTAMKKARQSAQTKMLPKDFHFTSNQLVQMFSRQMILKLQMPNNADHLAENDNLEDNFIPVIDQNTEDVSVAIDAHDMKLEESYPQADLFLNHDENLLPVDFVTPRRTHKIDLSYSKVQKIVDVKLLKENLWRKVEPKLEEAEEHALDLSRSARKKHQPEADTSFIQLAKEVKTDFSATGRGDEFSLSSCFVCMLHLANERNLHFSECGEYDFKIAKADPEVKPTAQAIP